MHELPSEGGSFLSSSEEVPPVADVQVTVNAALIAQIEALEVRNKDLTSQLASKKCRHFRIEEVSHDDSLIQFYTGFQTYALLFAFFEFLGPSVNCLQYWGAKNTKKN